MTKQAGSLYEYDRTGCQAMLKGRPTSIGRAGRLH